MGRCCCSPCRNPFRSSASSCLAPPLARFTPGVRAFVALLADVLRMSLLRIYVAQLAAAPFVHGLSERRVCFLVRLNQHSQFMGAALALAAVGLWRAPLCARQEGLNHPEYAFVSFS